MFLQERDQLTLVLEEKKSVEAEPTVAAEELAAGIERFDDAAEAGGAGGAVAAKTISFDGAESSRPSYACMAT